jgi:threonine dehydratase
MISFFKLHSVIHPRATTEFAYRYSCPENALVLLSFKLETPSRETEVAEILDALKAQGMIGYDISNDELMKSHARYLVGGPQVVPNERVFRFGKFRLQFKLFVLASYLDFCIKSWAF